VLILQPLTEPERLELAEHLSVAPFRKGELITRQGNEAHYLYIIIKGTAEVRVTTATGYSCHVTELGDGDVFGEMGLMTGEPRSTSVVALTDTVCYRLDKDGFKDALQRRPELAEAMSHLLTKRKLELDGLIHHLDADALQHRIQPTQVDLLERIRRFFTLS
jgi:CRP-like cAMP-binding protein